MKKIFALTTLALMLGACADNGSDTTTSNTDTVVVDDNTAAAGTGTAASGAASNPETLIIQRSSDIPTLDPGTTYDSNSSAIVENLYETLVTYDGNSISEFVPLLATDWSVSEDGLTYTLPIRQDVTFHTGNPLTCADVEYSIERNLVTNTGESGNWFIAEPLLGTPKNANDDSSITWEGIDNAVQCDGETAVFTLVAPDPAFIAKLAYAGQSIVDSQHAISIGEWDGTEATWKDWVGKDLNTSALAQDPSGTGPYKLVASDASGVTAAAYENYWGGVPPIKNVVVSVIPEASSRLQSFLNGDADLVDTGGREVMETQLKGQPNVNVIDDLEVPAAFGFTMNQDLEGSTVLGSGQWGDGLPANFFQDDKMRECFAKAFDYQAYIDQYQLGKGETPNVMLPKSFLGYDASIAPPQLDLAGAEEACKVAHGGEAWDKGFNLTASYSEGNPAQQIALEILKTNLEAMNPKFRINLQGLPWSDVISKAAEQPMIFVGWSPDYADPDNFITTFYGQDGYYNARSGINDPELESLVQEARSTIDEEERKALYSQITKRVAEKNYYLMTPIQPGFTVFHDDLQGRTAETYNPMYGGDWLWKNLSKQ